MLFPAVSGLAGIFLSPGVSVLRTSVVIDYQNVHLTARDVFDPQGETHNSLIDPVAFARRAVAERNSRQRPGYPEGHVDRILVFRGLPHIDVDGEQNRRCQEQRTAWTNGGAIVELRDLKYKWKMTANGPWKDIHGKKEAIGPGREKGIDVLCALACVREADRNDIDLVILASRDTDLVPALDEVHDLHAESPARFAKIETVAWLDRQSSFTGGSLKPSRPRRIWNTNLGRSVYEASIDRRDYL